MIKDMNYYRNLDLHKTSQLIPADSDKRQKDESFHDIIKSIILRYKHEETTSKDLLTYLGKPDSTRWIDSGEIWVYHWCGIHMNREYQGSDAFLIVDGLVADVVGQE